jgi:hypothetical protein
LLWALVVELHPLNNLSKRYNLIVKSLYIIQF